jgi:hypothetical protein
MLKRLSHGKADLRAWILRFTLLCFIVFHAFGLFHNHATALEHSACAACQVAEHQALDAPQIGLATSALASLSCVLRPWKPRAAHHLDFHVHPQPRGPPSSHTS